MSLPQCFGRRPTMENHVGREASERTISTRLVRLRASGLSTPRPHSCRIVSGEWRVPCPLQLNYLAPLVSLLRCRTTVPRHPPCTCKKTTKQWHIDTDDGGASHFRA